MGITSFVSSLYSVKSTGNILNPSEFRGFELGGATVAGIKVTTKQALAIDTVFACIRDKSESIGQLPVKLYRADGKEGKRNQVFTGRELRIFTKKPNEYQTMQEFIEMFVTSLETYGSFYAYVEYNSRNCISEIIPFRNQNAVSTQMDQNGRVFHTYVTNDNKPMTMYAGKSIIHIKQNTLDGFTGLSPISLCASTFGIAASQERHLASIMESGAMPKGILETDNIFKDEKALNRLKADWRAKQGGTAKSGETPILENGLKYKPLSLSPADAELILQRKFSREQICAIFRVPPRRVGAAEAGKTADIEQENKDYFQNRLVPLVTKLENAINLVLPDGLEIKLDEKGFIRGDIKSQVEAVSGEFKMGSISMNEMRVDLGREEIEGGDIHAIDTNNLTFGQLTDIPKIQEENRLAAQAALAKPEVEDDPDAE